MTKTIKWTYEKCFKEAQKYSYRTEFHKNRAGAYKSALKNGWLNDYTWMHTPPSKHKKWTYERCYDTAKKCSSFTDFRKLSLKAYTISVKKEWIKDYTWLKRTTKPIGYWNYDNCYNEAKKYKTKKELEIGNGSCYFAALRNKWLGDYTWMPKSKKRQSKWNRYKVFKIAQQFKTKSDFEKQEKGCYLAALKNGWIKEMDWFVPKSIEPMDLTKKSHVVYAYIDEDSKTVYVGLTYNIKNRHRRHKLAGSVFKYFSSLDKEIPEPLILKEKLTVQESRFYEHFFLNEYKKNGYHALNKAATGINTGSVGGGRIFYTKEKSFEIAKKYHSKIEFLKANASCYNRAKQKGWLETYEWLTSKEKVR